ncbi:ATP-binding protein [Geodermatophilus sp. FMUSA9-8]|uniref:ATP-binding protein n=1 Tax=Geodermatophilus sp. FMUSA9-8 TaxID=3120155 RepID=UPI0030094635
MASALQDGDRPDGVDDSAVERLLLAFEEPVSNGLRHGTPPVRASVTMLGDSWLLTVSDAAPDQPPAPAIGRDAADGGLGLYLIARLCSAHGWFQDGTRRTVWARLDHREAESLPTAVSRLRPRDGSKDSPRLR